MPTAIEIFKYLPKKNCGKCNFPTCLAFAMQLANSQGQAGGLPLTSRRRARRKLEASSAPPIRLVNIGHGRYQDRAWR